MKNIFALIVAFVLVCIVWGIIKTLIGAVLSPIIHIAMILLFCSLVYMVFKAMTRQKI